MICREIAFLIEETDSDYRYAEIARGLEVVAGEDAEPAGIERQPLAEAELHAEIGHTRKCRRTVGEGEPARRLEIGPPCAREPFHLGDERAVRGERIQPRCRDFLQNDPGVRGAVPGLGVDLLPQRVRLMTPGPAQVECKLVKRREPRRKIAHQYRHF
jgi:hypothetical protein